MSKKISPLAYFFVALLLMYLTYNYMPGRVLITGKLGQSIGILLGGFGTVMIILALMTLSENNLTAKPYEGTSKIINQGMYKISRNPVYFGMVLILMAVFCLMGSITSLVVVFVFAAIIDERIVKEEEAFMEAKFGQEYIQYKAKVSRWFPLLTEFTWEKKKKK